MHDLQSDDIDSLIQEIEARKDAKLIAELVGDE